MSNARKHPVLKTLIAALAVSILPAFALPAQAAHSETTSTNATTASVASTAVSTKDVKVDYWRWTKDTSPVRSGTTAKPLDPVLLKVPAGVKLHVTATNGNWSKVSYRGKVGYVYTSTHLVAKQPWNKVTKSTVRYAAKSAPLRAGTNRYPNDKILIKVPAGTKLTVSGTLGDWYRVSYKGKTGFIYKNNLISFPPLKTGTSLKYGGLTYAQYAGGIDWTKPVGVMIYLDGDYYPGYKKAVSNAPTGTTAKSMAKVAAKRNMVMVMPRLPQAGYTKSLGYTWWGKSATVAPMVKKLDARVRSQAHATKANTWYMGYSGGAEYITYELARRGQGSYGYGGAVLLAGGGGKDNGKFIKVSTPPAAFKKNFDMHWIVGSKDGVGQTANAKEWSAFKATSEGQQLYRSKGFKTTRRVLQGQDHHSYKLPTVMDRGLKDGGI